MIPIEIGEQPRLARGPAEPLAGARAGSGRIQAHERGEPAEMAAGLLWRLPGERHAESAADQRGDVAKSHTLFSDGVMAPCSRAVLAHQSV